MTKIDKMLFIGSKQPGLRCLVAMHQAAPHSLAGIMTLDDQQDSRSVFGEFRQFASDHNIPFHVAANRADSEKKIMAIQPDMCLVNGWYWLIGSEALHTVPSGFIGIHNSLLPRYRGGSPLVWTMINGEQTAGLSLFSFTEGMDEGDIWEQCTVKIGPRDDIGDVLAKLEDTMIAIIHDKYQAILDGTLRPRPQDHSQATYCASRTPEDGLIDWYRPATAVYNFIRAQSHPYPGAFTFYRENKMIIWKVRLDNATCFGSPGQIFRIKDRLVYVVCGDNRTVILEDVEQSGQNFIAGDLIKSVKTRFPSFTGNLEYLRYLLRGNEQQPKTSHG